MDRGPPHRRRSESPLGLGRLREQDSPEENVPQKHKVSPSAQNWPTEASPTAAAPPSRSATPGSQVTHIRDLRELAANPASVKQALAGSQLPVAPPPKRPPPAPPGHLAIVGSGAPGPPSPAGLDGGLHERAGLQLENLPGVEEGHIAQAFHEIDFDKNGFVGVSELRYLLTVLGERPTDAELDEMIRMIDEQGDGQVCYEDFLKLFAAGHPVTLQMAALNPEEADHIEWTSSATRRRNSLPSARDVGLLLKSASAFLHSANRRQLSKERRKILPKPKDLARVPGHRARPGTPRASPPISPLQARRDKAAQMRSSGSQSSTSNRASLASMPGSTVDFLNAELRRTSMVGDATRTDSITERRATGLRESQRY